jgi:hypothetical protein
MVGAMTETALHPKAPSLSDELGPKLRKPGVWVWHDNHAGAEPAGYERSTVPFEAADALDMQAREIEQLRAEIARLRARVLVLEAVHEDASGEVLSERERVRALVDTEREEAASLGCPEAAHWLAHLASKLA